MYFVNGQGLAYSLSVEQIQDLIFSLVRLFDHELLLVVEFGVIVFVGTLDGLLEHFLEVLDPSCHRLDRDLLILKKEAGVHVNTVDSLLDEVLKSGQLL